MSEFNLKEYQTVILGALLHDIGKFLNRGADVKRKHPYFSADYVMSEQFNSIVKDKWVDIDLLKVLVQCHHEYPQLPDDLLVQKIKDDHTRKLAYIVSRADSYSSGERIDEEPAELDYKQVRLASIFSKVKKNANNNPPFKYYRLQKMSPDTVFPVEDAELY
ncbi:MAG TPA: HD domain-containing protein, partial [Nitrospirae bacterium]|nr:HD domain-containing protein [Nitrospirota bacterium]